MLLLSSQEVAILAVKAKPSMIFTFVAASKASLALGLHIKKSAFRAFSLLSRQFCHRYALTRLENELIVARKTEILRTAGFALT